MSSKVALFIVSTFSFCIINAGPDLESETNKILEELTQTVDNSLGILDIFRADTAEPNIVNIEDVPETPRDPIENFEMTELPTSATRPTSYNNEPQNAKDSYIGGALYPQTSETRDLRSLDGIWNFRKSTIDPMHGYDQEWYSQELYKTGPVIQMPVPSSYNDVGVNASLRDHVGVVWYDRRFFVPHWWIRDKQRIWLRFGSVHYSATVWVNGRQRGKHEIGHLPFDIEITDVVNSNCSNILTVAVDNTLLRDTIPQGYLSDFFVGGKKTRVEQSYMFDFFNYAGIHRSVYLYSTPLTYIDDVIVNTDKRESKGFVVYNVMYKGETSEKITCVVQLFDKSNKEVTKATSCAGMLEISDAHFWWPYLIHPQPGYMYSLKASLESNGQMIDTYTEKVGIRIVSWDNSTIYINEKPVYLRGFGMHEDSDMRGRGWDPVLWVKNFNLIKWVGANAFRTSHYPYAEEILEMADENGIMVINEGPSIHTDFFTSAILEKHNRAMTDLIRRDKNHPSVIMWCLANEPNAGKKEANDYFGKVVQHVRSMDLSRPITVAIATPYTAEKIGHHLDVICFNRYKGWYREAGNLCNVARDVVNEGLAWRKKYSKPLVMTEYGADTIAGLHSMPEYSWSEEYQMALMSKHFKAFDKLRRTKFFNGEFIWNFADFKTAQSVTRVGGNKKGIFTRDRNPKAAAHHLRARYLALAAADNDLKPPEPAYYVSDVKPVCRIEL